MGNKLTIPECVLGELDGIYTPVAYVDGTVGVYGGRVEDPSGYPEYLINVDGAAYLDMRGFNAPEGKAGRTLENLMAFAFTFGRTGRACRERMMALRKEVLAAEDREAVYRQFLRDEGLESILSPDGTPREGALAFCLEDGEWRAIYIRDGVKLTLFRYSASLDLNRLALSANLALRIRCLEEIEARYSLALLPAQREGILEAMRL